MKQRRLTPADIAALAWPPDNERGEALAAKWESAERLDSAELLADVTAHLAAEMFRATPSHKAALAGAVLRAIDTYQVLYPPTAAHYVEYLLSHPTIGPREFYDELKRRYEEKHGKQPLSYRDSPSQ